MHASKKIIRSQMYVQGVINLTGGNFGPISSFRCADRWSLGQWAGLNPVHPCTCTHLIQQPIHTWCFLLSQDLTFAPSLFQSNRPRRLSARVPLCSTCNWPPTSFVPRSRSVLWKFSRSLRTRLRILKCLLRTINYSLGLLNRGFLLF